MRVTRTIKLKNEQGLHARPAGKIAKLSESFDAEIMVHYQNKEAHAHSVLELMLLGAHGGDQITLCAKGPQANEAIQELEKLINQSFQGVKI